MAIDISAIGYLMPVYSFLFVFIIVYALLMKTKLLGGVIWIDLIIAIIIAVIFSTLTSAQDYIQNVIPWFAVIVVVLFFVLFLMATGGKVNVFSTALLWVFVIVLLVIFIAIAIKTIPSLSNFCAGIRDFFINHAKIAGAIVLLIIAAIVAFIIIRK